MNEVRCCALLGAAEGDAKLGAHANNMVSDRRRRGDSLLDSQSDQRALSPWYKYRGVVIKK
jgi:hypothetical protein